ncbi:hypothetical protein AG1IA_00932 [Rhizoctonia solani AG-1 IA]|uniref:Uncharacterized protein n=1 Tax=Thanatephorus cucumeris (strain AG1-IA) TaxID=983506 RepID=L8X493_THACA|nr:hypothetical protein AG1IA_00932 [Rhizoctonia solani AG-1 IA]
MNQLFAMTASRTRSLTGTGNKALDQIPSFSLGNSFWFNAWMGQRRSAGKLVCLGVETALSHSPLISMHGGHRWTTRLVQKNRDNKCNPDVFVRQSHSIIDIAHLGVTLINLEQRSL